jgi:hypothetical protein
MRHASATAFVLLLTIGSSVSAAPPRVFLLDGKQLDWSQLAERAKDQTSHPALQRLKRDAAKPVEGEPLSVMNKERTPPSGDKHDYMSQAPYWWPDPAKPDGLPYTRKDGQRNPEIYKLTDATQIKRVSAAAHQRALAWYLTSEPSYAQHAATLLRNWFIDPQTRMNPNLRYAQAVPGVNDGRGTGIIETACLIDVVDAVGLLQGAPAWTADDDRAMREWFKAYLTWLLESPNGKDEAAAKNNHGTYYDVQVVTFALFVGDDATAKRVLQDVPTKRMAIQIEADGRQPLELERTKAWSYSVMNVRGLMQLAVLGEHVGVDLWHAKTDDGRGIRTALDYLVPYATGEQKWPHEQLNGFRPEGGAILLRRAALAYPDGPYAKLVEKLPPLPPDALDHLTGPRLVANEQDSR